MGNCCKKDSSIHFGGEDWTSATSESLLSNEESSFGYGNSKKGEEEELIGKNHASFSSNIGTEVKIKISKKQLEELVKRASLEGLTIQEAIIELMDVGDRYEHQHQRSWRPALQSIPETEVN
ncbi:hypothetical protein Leryth_013586 [Lithospermum erythrorhizon]|uniref:Uncharacterized protein n=1 Tax=Lithospermum erythrorhizon TaxID=34254 RepID=A0AAV3QUL1_LITER|nr:hypothetical protein Leryth_013586 [Lithospermum erythrorhizon]